MNTVDVKISSRARSLLNTAAKWNRSETSECAPNPKTDGLFCALVQARLDITGDSKTRTAAFAEARAVVEELTQGRKYEHRLMEYNNDRNTTFRDVENVLQLVLIPG